jgi:hypothetical protein
MAHDLRARHHALEFAHHQPARELEKAAILIGC